MKTHVKWVDGMRLEAVTDGNSLMMDAKKPIGSGTAMTPKELLAAGLAGCTAMDVLALLKKHKQDYKSLDTDVEIESSKSGHPSVFTDGQITFRVTGDVDPAVLMDAVRLSQTKFCGVSAMLSKAFPIKYIVYLNDTQVGEGQADFGGANE